FPACLPAHRTAPYSQPASSNTGAQPGKLGIWILRAVRTFYRALAVSPALELGDHWFGLSCIVYPVTSIELRQTGPSGATYIHEIHAMGVEPVEIVLSEKLEYTLGEKVPYVLVRPWRSNLLEPSVEEDSNAARRSSMSMERLSFALQLTQIRYEHYKRITSSSNIAARPIGSGGLLISTVAIM
ncbi:hypothetical protein V8B97DRAFT_2047945, partial [Scleroderma yunnanense]